MSDSRPGLHPTPTDDRKKKWPAFLQETYDDSDDSSSSSDETESSSSEEESSSSSDSDSETSNKDSKKDSKELKKDSKESAKGSRGKKAKDSSGSTSSDSSDGSDSDNEDEDEIDIAKKTLARSYFRSGKVVCPNFPVSETRVFVWNLSHQVTRDHVFEIFTAFGKIVGLFMPRFNEQLPEEFRFAVVQFSTVEERDISIRYMTGALIDNFTVQVSTEKPEFILGIDFSASSKMETRPQRVSSYRSSRPSYSSRYSYSYKSRLSHPSRSSRYGTRSTLRRRKPGRPLVRSRRSDYSHR